MKKRIICLCLLLIVFVSCFGLTVFAAEKEYTIDSAEFHIEINEDGSATVYEHWTVTYKKGSFSRFYKNIYTAVPKDEEFKIVFEDILVDGKQCVYTNDVFERRNYTYSVIKDNDTVRYEVYMNSENETRTFTIVYTLQDVIKCVDNKYYLFKYRLLPKGFQQNIKNFYVDINFPDYTYDSISLIATKGSSELESYGATIYANNVSGLYKVTFKFDGNMPSSIFINQENSSLNSLDNVDGDIVSALFSGFLVIVVVGLTVFAVVSNSRQTKKIREELALNPNLLINIYKKWVPKYFTPAEFATVLIENKCLSYLVYLAELTNRGVTKIKPDYQYIAYPVDCHDNAILQVLEECRLYALKKKRDTESDEGYWLLPVQYIEMYFKRSKGYKMVYNHTYLPLSKCKSIEDKKLLEDVQKMRDVARVMHIDGTLPIVEFSNIVETYKTATHNVAYYCFQKQDKKTDASRDESFYLTALALSAYAATHSSSISGCSSCSSCSSCGGCGGCGGSD